jgi:hypothetical protein
MLWSRGVCAPVHQEAPEEDRPASRGRAAADNAAGRLVREPALHPARAIHLGCKRANLVAGGPPRSRRQVAALAPARGRGRTSRGNWYRVFVHRSGAERDARSRRCANCQSDCAGFDERSGARSRAGCRRRTGSVRYFAQADRNAVWSSQDGQSTRGHVRPLRVRASLSHVIRVDVAGNR